MPKSFEMTLTQRSDGYFEADEATGRALDAVLDDDRAFFAANPERRLRVREPHAVERRQFGLDQDDLPRGCYWYISVKRTGPHTRKRAAFWASPLHEPGAWSEAACAVLFEQLAMAAHEE
jgi:hypothetical protein